MSSSQKISAEEFSNINSNNALWELIEKKDLHVKDLKEQLLYEKELRSLQVQLVNLQRWVVSQKKRIIIIFEGRDAAGKGGNIRRFVEHLNPRSIRRVALTKPTEEENGQWYFRRYIKELPNQGEIVFFDRSWYNRAVVEPVMGFCTEKQYATFMVQVPEFEHMLYEDGVIFVKFWFSISKEEQSKRFQSRITSPLKRWKYSSVDEKGQELWDQYTYYKEQMFSRTHTSYSPWIVVKANDKRKARLECIRYVLSLFDYDGKANSETSLIPDPNIITRYFRSSIQID